MDPATGTFTTMDTYGGSLSDPMSLHKYLFANSNPVMYCDPSGHSTSLTEAVCVVGIIGALAGADLYVLNIVSCEGEITPEGMVLSVIIGAVVAVAIFFAIYALASVICNAIVSWGVFSTATGTITKAVICKMIESGLINALEYELVWAIAGIKDINNGTNYSSNFSSSGIVKNFAIGFILGLLGYGTDLGLEKIIGQNDVITGLVLRVNASIVAALFYYGGVMAYKFGAPEFVVDILNYIGGYHMSIVTNGLSLGEGGVINLGELITDAFGVSYDIVET